MYLYSPSKTSPFASYNITLKLKYLSVSPLLPPTVLSIVSLPSFLMLVNTTLFSSKVILPLSLVAIVSYLSLLASSSVTSYKVP